MLLQVPVVSLDSLVAREPPASASLEPLASLALPASQGPPASREPPAAPGPPASRVSQVDLTQGTDGPPQALEIDHLLRQLSCSCAHVTVYACGSCRCCAAKQYRRSHIGR